jgi:hypothetical protein
MVVQVSWQHKIEAWERPASADCSNENITLLRRTLESKLDALSDGGWELVKFSVRCIGMTEFFWTLWKRRVDG